MAGPPSKKPKREGRHLKNWELEKDFLGLIKSSCEGPQYTFCIPCGRNVKVAASGKFDLVRHFETESHKNAVKKKKQFTPLTEHFKPDKESVPESNAIEAEVAFCKFMAEHNLPASIADHFTEFVKKVFHDSKAATDFACKRTKATQIIKNCLAPDLTEPLLEHCRKKPFSLMIDESNDRNTVKRLVILARVFEGRRANTRLLALPVLPGGTAEIFEAVRNVIESNNIPWKNVVGFASDNCNTMIGRRNSVLSRLKEKNPNIFSIGCICHLANLCVKSAVKELSVPVDDFLVDIYYFFEHSSKRRTELKEFQLFAEVEEQDILKHCPTRWLSLERVIKRTLTQYPALVAYFKSHPDGEKPGRVKRILDQLLNPITKPTFLFLAYVLPMLNEFNKVFQADSSKVGFIIPEMNRLLKVLMHKFVKMAHIKGVALTSVQFQEMEKQHDDDKLAVGMECRSQLAEMEDEGDLSPQQREKLFNYVRKFYAAAVKKMIDKFPFEDETLSELAVLDTSARESLDYQFIVNLATKFLPEIDQEPLKEEWDDFRLMDEEELPVPVGNKVKTDELWGNILNMKTSFKTDRYPVLRQVMGAVLCLPHSNADSERVFTMVRKIHTDSRSKLAPDTLEAFLKVKLNSDSCCYDASFSKSLLAKAKSCTHEYNKAH